MHSPLVIALVLLAVLEKTFATHNDGEVMLFERDLADTHDFLYSTRDLLSRADNAQGVLAGHIHQRAPEDGSRAAGRLPNRFMPSHV